MLVTNRRVHVLLPYLKTRVHLQRLLQIKGLNTQDLVDGHLGLLRSYYDGAKALMPFSLCSTATNSGSVARSILLSRMRSAKATCSTASFSAPVERRSRPFARHASTLGDHDRVTASRRRPSLRPRQVQVCFPRSIGLPASLRRVLDDGGID